MLDYQANILRSAKKNLSEYGDCPSGEGFNIHIVVSDWNTEITSKLLKGAKETLIAVGVIESDIEVINVPGAFELPVAAKSLLKSVNSDSVICLGCVIKGETDHDKYINAAVAAGIMNLGLMSGKPVIFGVLTPNDRQQAEDRAGGQYGNKGVEAAITALKMAQMKDVVKNEGQASIGFC